MVRAEHGFGQCFSPVAHRVLALRSDRLSKDYLRKKDALRSVHKLDVAPGKRGDDNSSRGRILASSSKLCSHCVPSSSRVVTRIFGKSRLLIAWGGFGLSLQRHEICDRRNFFRNFEACPELHRVCQDSWFAHFSSGLANLR